MSYDLHGSWERQAGIHTALFPRSGEQGANRELNVAGLFLWLIDCLIDLLMDQLTDCWFDLFIIGFKRMIDRMICINESVRIGRKT